MCGLRDDPQVNLHQDQRDHATEQVEQQVAKRGALCIAVLPHGADDGDAAGADVCADEDRENLLQFADGAGARERQRDGDGGGAAHEHGGEGAGNDDSQREARDGPCVQV